MEGKHFRLMSINVNCLNKDTIIKLKDIPDYDILLIRETHNGLTNYLNVLSEEQINAIVINNDLIAKDTKGGVATLIKNKKGFKWERKEEDILKGD